VDAGVFGSFMLYNYCEIFLLIFIPGPAHFPFLYHLQLQFFYLVQPDIFGIYNNDTFYLSISANKCLALWEKYFSRSQSFEQWFLVQAFTISFAFQASEKDEFFIPVKLIETERKISFEQDSLLSGNSRIQS
jgi:hypothetical protein